MRASFRSRCGLLLVWLLGPALVASADEDAAKAKSPSAAESAIAALLTADVTPGKSRPESIAPLYDKARALAPRDPRLEYAYSLVLLRLFQAGEAREHLDRALALDPMFAQANQSVIRDLFKNKKFVEAGERLAAYAARLDPSRPESGEVAEWLGRVTG
ncbi:MAG TPA: hypothetical protein VM452_08670, partial [Caulifigura sp.]|nr:hypothetical protein [Caulifigura sp.]